MRLAAFRFTRNLPRTALRRPGKGAGTPAGTAGTAGLHGPGHPCPTLDLVGMGVNRIGKEC